jgi:Primase X
MVTATIIDTSNKVQNGLEFMLRHVAPIPYFPRNIMTHKLGKQILVHSIEDTMNHYRESEFLDCRISAYPPPPSTLSTKYLGNGLAPNLIMIDIDRLRFTTERAYELAVSKTLKNIESELSSEPTVIWSGNGSHIIQPMEAVILEELELFSPTVIGTDQPSVKFLRWTEEYLSGGKSDPAHTKTLSFGNCMLRVPGSHNSKCVRANNGILSEKTEVKITHEWDGRSRPTIMLLIGSFHAYLVDQKLKQKQRERRQQRKPKYSITTGTKPWTISWIEKLLTMSIADYRKYCIWRIFAPYLINIRKLQDDQATHTIREWLEKCNSVKRISFDETSRIKYNIQSVRKKGFYPIGWNQLKTENKELFEFLKNA